MTTVLHVSPHADDEMLGCPGTLLSLRDAGVRVVNLLLNLSPPEEVERRTSEAVEAHRRSGLELRVFDAPRADEEVIAGAVADLLAELGPEVVIGPQPHDIHEAHELAARATRRALESQATRARWWMWGVWADLALPTLLTPFGEQRMEEIVYVLSAYRGEVERNDYRSLARGRGVVGAVAGSERVFGFGAPKATSEPYADLLTEVRLRDDRWMLASPTVFAGLGPPSEPGVADVTDWLDTASGIRLLRRPHRRR